VYRCSKTLPEEKNIILVCSEARKEAEQGDQIGRMFAIVYFGQCFLKTAYKRSGYFFPRYKSCLNFEKELVGLYFGLLFKNASGHPEAETRAEV
jgi:hypothetical protein